MNEIVCGDCIKEMRKMPPGSFGLVVTSPPYNLRNSTGNYWKTGGGRWKRPALLGGYTGCDDAMPYPEYVGWQRACLGEMMRLLKPGGAIFYNQKWRVQGGLIQDRREITDGFPVRQIIVWERQGGVNFNDSFFLPTYEVIFLIAKRGFRLRPGANAAGDVWRFGQERGNPHPAPFPVRLAARAVSATDADPVLDPFMGSGTTAVACESLGRGWMGIEQSEEYCAAARGRIARNRVSSELSDVLSPALL